MTTQDPVCGMTVDDAFALRPERKGQTFYFGIGIVSEKKEVNHATIYDSRLYPFSSGVPP
jgi:YHS domain-containing protein